MDGTRAKRLNPWGLPRIPRLPAGAVGAGDAPWSPLTFLCLALMWPVTYSIALALEPAPANPHAMDPAWVVGLGVLFMLGWLSTAVLAITHHPRAPKAAFLTGVPILALAVSCPVSGHHHLGAWWFAQMAVLLVPTLWAASLTRKAQPAAR